MSNRAPVTTEDTAGGPCPLTPGLIVPGVPPYYDIAAGVVVPAAHAPSHAVGGSDPVIGPLALQAGSVVAGTAPLKLASGPLLTVPEVGAVEFLTDQPHMTITTGAARKPIVLADAALTSGRIPFETTNGRLTDSSTLVRDPATNQVGITTTANTGVLVTDTTGLGELAYKARCSAGTGTAGQSGFDFGFSAAYRATFAVAGAAVGAPFGAAAYMYLAGVPLRFISDAATRGMEFYPNFAYAGRFYGTTLQMGANGTTASTVNIPAYLGKNSSTVQLRLGDTSGNCWSMGRDSATGDLIVEPTAPAGTTPFAGALKVLGASGKTVATFGLVLPKTSGYGILVDTAAPTFPWKNIIGLIAVKGTGANDPDWEVFRDTIYQYRWTNGNMRQVWDIFSIPMDYVPGTDVWINVHWDQNVVDTGGPAGVPGTVKWYFDVSYAKGYGTPGGAADAFNAIITTSVTQQGSTTQYGHMTAGVQLTNAGGDASHIDRARLEPNGIFKVRLYRDSGDAADTLNEHPFVGMITVQHQSTGIGTKQRVPPFYT